MQEENRLLPVGTHALRAGTEARYPLLTGRLVPSLTRPSFWLESPSKRPHLRDDRGALVRDTDLGRWRDRHSQRREERVEVQHEGVNFRAFCRGADEGEGRLEIELTRLYVRDVYVLHAERALDGRE